MKDQYYPPNFNSLSFNCPFCGVYAQQDWRSAWEGGGMGVRQVNNLNFTVCKHCDGRGIWLDEKIIFPSVGGVAMPNRDLPQSILEDYQEAKDILDKSPRGAAALLRLSIQKLCKELGGKGKNINDDIGELVKKGLPTKIQQALDYVRVIGNNAVHPGQIEISDNREIALSLFGLVNVIAEVMISQPKEIELLYNSLPEEQLKAIEKRDGKAGI